MNDRYKVSVTTRIFNSDKTLFADLGTMIWPTVNDDMRLWLAGSCRKTAFWLVTLPEHKDGYILMYRTLVEQDDNVISDTGELEFEGLSYDDVIKFEHWALDELREMIELFNANHTKTASMGKKRNKVKQVWKWGKTLVNTKLSR